MGTQADIQQNEKLNRAYIDYINNPSEDNLSLLLLNATPLIKHFALYFSGGRFDNDAVQAGYEGVLKAIKKYNPAFDTTFATYAGHWIMGEIRHYIRTEMRYYKPPCIHGLQEKALKLAEKYYVENGEIPAKSQLAKALNVKEEGIDEILRAGLVSFEVLEVSKISSVKYESFKLPVEDQIVLYEAIRKLSALKRSVIYCLFFKNYTQQQTADSLGLNQRKVSRLLKSSLTDLKEKLDTSL
ncbi:MAG: sigma-70 family RNA polymerase sigma factor [Clostridia bacterium]|nr:sigma-70 family RNA polymerase sigma factor [Clostridia bacterium]